MLKPTFSLGLLSFIFLFVADASWGRELVSFSSLESQARLSRSSMKHDFFQLANHFESQPNAMFCGPTTAVIVLNTFRAERLRAETIKVRKDLRVLQDGDRQFAPNLEEILFNRYTTNNVFDVQYRAGDPQAVKARAAVMGEPAPGSGRPDFGFQLRDFARLLEAHGLSVELSVAEPQGVEIFRRAVQSVLGDQDRFLVVNYDRKTLGQKGGGHISPLGAYDADTDSVLILDVNPNRAEWVWVSVKDLFSAMATFDTVENRGYLILSDPT